MKSLLKSASILGFAITIFSLTACSGQPNFDVTLDDRNGLAIQTDYFELTNQEVFELVASGYVGDINPGVSIILDWADYIILSDVEIDEQSVEEEIEMLDDFLDEDEIHEMLIVQGFDNLEAYAASIRLRLMREQAVLDAVEITPEEIQAAYDEWFAPPEDEEDDPYDNNDEEHEEQTPDDDIHEMIEDMLKSEALQAPGFEQEVLATLREEAGLTIYSSYFATRYENFLASWTVEDVAVATGRHDSAIASINGHYLTVDELFNRIIAQFALGHQSPLLDYINIHVLDEIYEVDRNTIRSNINAAKVAMMDWFYPQMEAQGLFTERQIFNAFLLDHLEGLAFEDAFLPISTDRLQELYDEHVENLIVAAQAENTPQRSARHILVDDVALAEDLITQLQDVDEDEVEELFIELAEEYSTCPSAANGGSLGSFSPGQMVTEFNDTVFFELELYEFTTEPVETDFGFHVIYLYEIEEIDDDAEEVEADIPTFEEMRAALTENEIHRLRVNYFANVMFDLREEQNIRFHHERLQTQYEALLEQNRRNVED